MPKVPPVQKTFGRKNPSSDKRDKRTLVPAIVPNFQSGHNPNTPVKRYLTAPNRARFKVGDPVILADYAYSSPYVGHVVGFAGGTNVWVEWPHLVDQHPVEELLNIHPKRSEWAFSGDPGSLGVDREMMRRKPPRKAGRQSVKRKANSPWMDPVVVQRLKSLGVHDADIHHVAQLYNYHQQNKANTQTRVPLTQMPPTQVLTKTPVGPEGPNRKQVPYDPTDVTMVPDPGVPWGSPSLDSGDEIPVYTPHQAPIYRKSSKVRRAGITTLERVIAWGESKKNSNRWVATLRGSQKVAKALSLLFEQGQRKASGDRIARVALKRAIQGNLRVATYLHRQGHQRASEAVLMGTLNSFLYPQGK